MAVDSYLICEPTCIHTTASLEVTVGGTTIFSGSYPFKVDDQNGSGGNPTGANPDAFWDAFSFDVRLVCSVNVD